MDDMNMMFDERQTSEMDDLESMFGDAGSYFEEIEQVSLTQSLEGFASCFPDWDLHPPIK